MAEPVIGGNGSKPPKEMSMEVRLLLAFVAAHATSGVADDPLASAEAAV